jgi:hypothetical protein
MHVRWREEIASKAAELANKIDAAEGRSRASVGGAIGEITRYLDVLAEPEFPPDCNEWGKHPQLQLWHAVALSLDFDPSKLVGGWDGIAIIRKLRWGPQPLGVQRTNLFQARLALAEAKISAEFATTSYMEPKRHSFVALKPFAQWAMVKAEWPVPPGFSVFAELIMDGGLRVVDDR